MNHYGVILRQLRALKKLPIKEAARRIEKSAGWLSEIENSKGSARIHPQEFERIVAAYEGEPYRKQFGIWAASSHKQKASVLDASFGGAVLKFLRKKAKMPLKEAARGVGFSACYLSCIETGSKPLAQPLRDKLMRIYGYSPASFKNFTTEDKRSKNVPVRYKLALLLRQLDEARVEKVLGFALSVAEAPAASQSSPQGAL
jgi:transcriptional regulator with XRE-family HTH domain